MKHELMVNRVTAVTFFLVIVTVCAQAQMQYVSPRPGSLMQHPNRNIVIRPGEELDVSSLSSSFFSVVGSVSGVHNFDMVVALDRKTINLNPDKPFVYGEKISVTVRQGIRSASGAEYEAYSFSFSIHREYTAQERQELSQALVKIREEDIGSGFQNQNLSLTTQSKDFTITYNTNPAAGQTFFSNNTGTQKLWIIQNNGDSVFSQLSPSDGYGWTLNHNNYMTVYNNTGSFDMFDSNYVNIGNFKVINGYPTDPHEFQIFPDGHYFMIGDDQEIIDMTVYNPNYQPNAKVTGSVIQEFDAQNNLLFEWNSFDYVDIPEALHENLANAYIDYVHMNAIEQDDDGNILVSCRHLDQIDKIDLSTGDFIWRLGGVKNEYKFTNDTAQFNYQHDVRRLPNGDITLMDNNNWGTPNIAYAKEYQLNEVKQKAKLVWSYAHPPINGKNLTSSATGSVQRFANGNTLIDWGLPPYTGGFPNFTEVDSNNTIVWELAYNGTPLVYRAHRANWNPCARPSASKLSSTNITSTSATLNWNAATEVAKYYIEYRKQGAKRWKNKKVNSSKLSYTLTGLLAGTTYEWNMNTWCDLKGTTQSAFTATKTFTTATAKEQTITIDEVPSLTVYPNPASDLLIIDWTQSNSLEQNAIIQTVNLMGQVILERKLTSKEGENESVLDLHSLSDGLYIIRVKVGDKQFVLKFIKE